MNEVNITDVIKITDSKEIQKRWNSVKNHYPRMLSRWVHELETKYTTDAELCLLGYRSLFESTLRLVGWILASIYLQDKVDNKQSEQEIDDLIQEIKNIENQLESLGDPTLGKWKKLIEFILEYYFKKENQSRFPIKELLYSRFIITGRDKDRKQGYTYFYTKNLKRIRSVDSDDATKRISALNAGNLLRNVFSHINIADPAVFSDIKIYFQDILLQTFEAFSFLNNDPCQTAHPSQRKAIFQIVTVDHQQGTGQILHGSSSDRITLSGKNIDPKSDVQFYLHHVNQDTFYPLFPFLLKDTEQWDIYGELILSKIKFTPPAHNRSLDTTWLEYRSWDDSYEKDMTQDSVEYQIFHRAYETKKQLIRYDALTSAEQFRKRAISLSIQTIQQYRGKYFPESYIKRDSLQKQIDSFVANSTTSIMLVTGEAGVGKSAWLCSLVDEWVSVEKPPVIPVFINAGNAFNLIETNVNTVWAKLLRRQFDIKREESVTSLMDFIRTLQQLREKEPITKLPQVIFAIDALNESSREDQLFMSLSEIIHQCRDRQKYGWLKFIVTSRKPYVELVRIISQSKSKWADHLDLFHNYRSGESGATSTELPYLKIDSFTNDEILATFFQMLRSGELPYLEEMASPETFLRPHLNYLRTPLLIRFYSRLLDNRLARNKELPETFSQVLTAYYKELESNQDLNQSLLSICQIMVDQQRNYLTIDEKIALKHNNQGRYLNPIDYLEEEFILSESFRTNAANEVELVFQFTHERFAEYAIARYLIGKYQPNWIHGLQALLAVEKFAGFYENAISLYVQLIWRNDQGANWTQLLTFFPAQPNRDRYASNLVGALFEEWRDDFAFDKSKVDLWKQKIQNFVTHRDYFIEVPRFSDHFHRKAQELFSDRINAIDLYDYCLETAVQLFQEEDSYEKCNFLISYCRRLIDKGKEKEFKAYLDYLLPTITNKMSDLEKKTLSKNSENYYTTDFQNWQFLHVEYTQISAERWLLYDLIGSAIEMYEHACFFLNDILNNCSKKDPLWAVFIRKNAQLYGRLGDLYYTQRNFEKADQAYLVSGVMIVVRLNSEDPVEKAQFHHQTANSFEKTWKDVIFKRACAVDLIKIAFKNNPDSLKIKILYLEYFLNYAEKVITTNSPVSWIEIEFNEFEQIIYEFKKLADSNITFQKLVMRYYYIQGLKAEILQDNILLGIDFYKNAIQVSKTLNLKAVENVDLHFPIIDTNLSLLRIYNKNGDSNNQVLYYFNANALIVTLAEYMTDESLNWKLGLYYYKLAESSVNLLPIGFSRSYIEKAINYFTQDIKKNESFPDAELYLARSYSLLSKLILDNALDSSMNFQLRFNVDSYRRTNSLKIEKSLIKARSLIQRSLQLKRKLLTYSDENKSYLNYSIAIDKIQKLHLFLLFYQRKPKGLYRNVSAIILRVANTLRIIIAQRIAPSGFFDYGQRQEITTSLILLSQIYSYIKQIDEINNCLQVLNDFLSALDKAPDDYLQRSLKLDYYRAKINLAELIDRTEIRDAYWEQFYLLCAQCTSGQNSERDRKKMIAVTNELFHYLWSEHDELRAELILFEGIKLLRELNPITKPELYFYQGIKKIWKRFWYALIVGYYNIDRFILWSGIVQLDALRHKVTRERQIAQSKKNNATQSE